MLKEKNYKKLINKFLTVNLCNLPPEKKLALFILTFFLFSLTLVSSFYLTKKWVTSDFQKRDKHLFSTSINTPHITKNLFQPETNVNPIEKNFPVENTKNLNSTSAIDVTDCYFLSEGSIWSPKYDGATFRFGGTDTNAVYRRVILPVLTDTEYTGGYFQIKGEYPDSTYFSYHLNDEKTHFISKLTDYEIYPDANSTNPFQTGGKISQQPLRYSKNNFYTLNITEQEMGLPNTLQGGFLDGVKIEQNVIMYRIYEPHDQQREGRVKIPQIYFQPKENQVIDKEKFCQFMQQNFQRKGDKMAIFMENKILDKKMQKLAQEADSQKIPGYQPPNPVSWIIGTDFPGMIKYAFPSIPLEPSGHPTGANMDTRYLAGYLDPHKEVTLIRFKAPKINEQVRYWSIGSYQPFNGLMYAYDCSRYNELLITPDNYVNMVFSMRKNKPSSACSKEEIAQKKTNCLYNWMEYSGPATLIWIRQLVSDTSYPESLIYYQDDPYNSEAIKAHLKEYYPQAIYCSRTDFEEKGWSCFE